MPTHPREKTPDSARIYLDVADLDRSAAFYNRVLGFRVVGVHRPALPYEARMMRREAYPGVMLIIRQSYRRPVLGSVPGGLTRIAFYEPDLARKRAELEGVVKVMPPSDRAAPSGQAGPDGAGGPGHIEFFDPDGYVIELFEA